MKTLTPEPFEMLSAPEALLGSAAKAKARTLTRRHGPPLTWTRTDDGAVTWEWPFERTDGDDPDWRWLLLDAFGTRHPGVASTFLSHLLRLCKGEVDVARQEYIPREEDLVLMLHVISAHRPKDEAQAALAAQIAATHLLTMRVGERVADYPWDTRMISAYAKLARASASQFEAMATLKGRRTARQQISVRHEKHIHQHQHVHMGGGVTENGHQADAHGAGRSAPECPSLPCSDTSGTALSGSSGEEQAGLPHARRRSRVRRTEG